ncbi:hypothetical protein scyTo_0021234, partial [Scyliorhinus torazame]|nr:hypothetical protein [Scyliorhinus torazame]
MEKLKFVTVLGAGLLCGTALAIIIPEGIELLLSDLMAGASQNPGHPTSDGQQSSSSQHPVSVTQPVASTST